MSSGLEGKTLGQYRLTERLGRGGMAEVYKAYQPGLDRYVAIKVLHAYFAEEEDFRNRFQREARAVARLRHSNVVQVYDFGVEGDIYYMAMEFLSGGTLKQRLRQADELLAPAETLRIVERVAAALDYAHARGIYHRDVKPSNVMLTDDRQVILTDFGLAKMAEGSQFTRSGMSVGTPEYMAPEQGQGLPIDHRADVYSLGVVLYELLTGQVPYTADTPVAIIFKHIIDPLPLPRSLNADLDQGLERVILKALAKSPADRYQSAGELAAGLRQALADSDQDLPTPPPAPAPDTQVLPPAGPPAPPFPPAEVDAADEEPDGHKVEAPAKTGFSNKKWFLTGCLTSLLLLACLVCGLLALGNCGRDEVGPPGRHTPVPASPPSAEPAWDSYQGLGLSIRHPADWEVRPLNDLASEGVQFVQPAPDVALSYTIHLRRDAALPLDHLLESFRERIGGHDAIELGTFGNVQTTNIGGESARGGNIDGVYRHNGQPFQGQVWAVNHGGRSYLIVTIAPASRPEAMPIFRDMTASLRFMP